MVSWLYRNATAWQIPASMRAARVHVAATAVQRTNRRSGRCARCSDLRLQGPPRWPPLRPSKHQPFHVQPSFDLQDTLHRSPRLGLHSLSQGSTPVGGGGGGAGGLAGGTASKQVFSLPSVPGSNNVRQQLIHVHPKTLQPLPQPGHLRYRRWAGSRNFMCCHWQSGKHADKGAFAAVSTFASRFVGLWCA